jgi:hypothetical protein
MSIGPLEAVGMGCYPTSLREGKWARDWTDAEGSARQ